jgi:hypothetical protein
LHVLNTPKYIMDKFEFHHLLDLIIFSVQRK